jgi:hypothetical protein
MPFNDGAVNLEPIAGDVNTHRVFGSAGRSSERNRLKRRRSVSEVSDATALH